MPRTLQRMFVPIKPAGRQVAARVATFTAWFLLCSAITHANPLSNFSAPDPCIVRAGGKTYLYSTGYGWGEGAFPIRVATNKSLSSWKQVGSIISETSFPLWTKKDSRFWAPEVHLIDGQYVSYFSAESAKSGRFCIGAAVASRPQGPFVAENEPLVCSSKVGLIDPTYFRDPASGQGYACWKEDSNDLAPQRPTNLVLQKVSQDGLRVFGKRRPILKNDAAWEGELIEGGSFIYRKGFYYLFYSGNVYSDDRYGVGVARSRSLEGPYKKFSGNPILKSDDRFSGPGHQFIVPGTGDDWTIFYHARDKTRQKWQSARLLMKDAIRWSASGWPHIHDGTPSHVDDPTSHCEQAQP